MKIIYEVISSFDRSSHTVAFVESEKAAKEMVDQISTPGSMEGGSYSKHILYKDKKDFEDNKPEIRRQRALDKLTDADIEALGIKR